MKLKNVMAWDGMHEVHELGLETVRIGTYFAVFFLVSRCCVEASKS